MIPTGQPEDKQPNEALQKASRTATPPVIATSSAIASRSFAPRYRGRGVPGSKRERGGHRGSANGGPDRSNRPPPRGSHWSQRGSRGGRGRPPSGSTASSNIEPSPPTPTPWWHRSRSPTPKLPPQPLKRKAPEQFEPRPPPSRLSGRPPSPTPRLPVHMPPPSRAYLQYKDKGKGKEKASQPMDHGEKNEAQPSSESHDGMVIDQPAVKHEPVDTALPIPPQPSRSPQPRVKREYQSPSPDITDPVPNRRLVTAWTNFHALPENCAKTHANYNANRREFLRQKLQDIKSKGLRVVKSFFRADGLVIEWTSPTEVWSDTMKAPVIDLAKSIEHAHKMNHNRTSSTNSSKSKKASRTQSQAVPSTSLLTLTPPSTPHLLLAPIPPALPRATKRRRTEKPKLQHWSKDPSASLPLDGTSSEEATKVDGSLLDSTTPASRTTVSGINEPASLQAPSEPKRKPSPTRRFLDKDLGENDDQGEDIDDMYVDPPAHTSLSGNVPSTSLSAPSSRGPATVPIPRRPLRPRMANKATDPPQQSSSSSLPATSASSKRGKASSPPKTHSTKPPVPQTAPIIIEISDDEDHEPPPRPEPALPPKRVRKAVDHVLPKANQPTTVPTTANAPEATPSRPRIPLPGRTRVVDSSTKKSSPSDQLAVPTSQPQSQVDVDPSPVGSQLLHAQDSLPSITSPDLPPAATSVATQAERVLALDVQGQPPLPGRIPRSVNPPPTLSGDLDTSRDSHRADPQSLDPPQTCTTSFESTPSGMASAEEVAVVTRDGDTLPPEPQCADENPPPSDPPVHQPVTADPVPQRSDPNPENPETSSSTVKDVDAQALEYLQRWILAFDKDRALLETAYAPEALFSCHIGVSDPMASSGVRMESGRGRIVSHLLGLGPYLFGPRKTVEWETFDMGLLICLVVHGEVGYVPSPSSKDGGGNEPEGAARSVLPLRAGVEEGHVLNTSHVFVLRRRTVEDDRRDERDQREAGSELDPGKSRALMCDWPSLAVSHHMTVREGTLLNVERLAGEVGHTWMTELLEAGNDDE